MKKFKLKANIIFEAENIDDAFSMLSEHFSSLYYNSPANLLDFRGEMKIDPLISNQKEMIDAILKAGFSVEEFKEGLKRMLNKE